VALYRRLTVVTKANKSLENATKCEYIGMTVKRWIKLKRDSVWMLGEGGAISAFDRSYES